jgi:hypothetical protein
MLQNYRVAASRVVLSPHVAFRLDTTQIELMKFAQAIHEL